MPFIGVTDEEKIKEFLAMAALHMLLLEDGRGKINLSIPIFILVFFLALTSSQRAHLTRIVWAFFNSLTLLMSPEVAEALQVQPLVLNGFANPPTDGRPGNGGGPSTDGGAAPGSRANNSGGGASN